MIDQSVIRIKCAAAAISLILDRRYSMRRATRRLLWLWTAAASNTMVALDAKLVHISNVCP